MLVICIFIIYVGQAVVRLNLTNLAISEHVFMWHNSMLEITFLLQHRDFLPDTNRITRRLLFSATQNASRYRKLKFNAVICARRTMFERNLKALFATSFVAIVARDQISIIFVMSLRCSR